MAPFGLVFKAADETVTLSYVCWEGRRPPAPRHGHGQDSLRGHRPPWQRSCRQGWNGSHKAKVRLLSIRHGFAFLDIEWYDRRLGEALPLRWQGSRRLRPDGSGGRGLRARSALSGLRREVVFTSEGDVAQSGSADGEVLRYRAKCVLCGESGEYSGSYRFYNLSIWRLFGN